MHHVLLTLLLIAGCDDDKPSPGSTADDTAITAAGVDTGTTLEVDDTGEGGETNVDLTEGQEWTTRPFDPSGTSGSFREVVPDFTWKLLDGSTWNLQENWTGYDSYVAVNLFNESFPVEVTSANELEKWLVASPLNVHWFFLVYSDSPATIANLLETAKANVEGAMDGMDPDLAAHWTGRIHYVTDSAWSAEWIGALNAENYVDQGDGNYFAQFGAAIDRFQVARETGYYCDPYDGWNSCPPEFLPFEPQYFNFESDRQDWLDSRGDVTTLAAFTDEPASDGGWAGQRIYAEIEFPDAAAMATYDTMEFDLTLACADSPELVYCPDWDYLVYAHLCDVDDPETADVDESESCGTEIGRWITTYWRGGRWVHDVTPFLALLQDGGTRRISFYTQQYYDVSLEVRLSNQGVGARPVAMEPLYTGGTFNERYNWGLNHSITDDSWVAWTDEAEPMSWDITQRDDEAGWLVAENGQDQPVSRGMWSRFDWTVFEDTLYICRTITAEGDEEDALAAEPADSADLATGCKGGAWRVMAAPDDAAATGLNGDWTELWHESKLPITFTPPAGATRVGVTAVISGHGFGNTQEGCAEFCDHQHRFTINDAASYTKTHGESGSRWGCAEQVGEGVVPNQAGTWIFGRAGWCPGLEVRPWSVDITGDVTPGVENTLGYTGLFEGEVNYVPKYNNGYSSTDARIDMQSYLVYYE